MIDSTTARRRLRTGAAVLATACAAAAGLAAAGHVPTPSGALRLSEGAGGCAAPSGPLAAGPVSFRVTDDSRDFLDVYVIAGRGDDVYAEIQNLPPHATLPLSTDLGAGSYAVRCVFSDGTTNTSAPLLISGGSGGSTGAKGSGGSGGSGGAGGAGAGMGKAGTGGTDEAVPGYPALPDLALQTPVREYSVWVQARLPRLLADSRALDAAVAGQDRAAAQRAWLTAHLDYERLGAAYNAFGDFDGEIDGMAGGLPQGVTDSSWTGFFAVEYGLWHGDPLAAVRTLTKRLVTNVSGLIQDFPSEEVDPGDLALRTHEILENALQFQVTGIADYGSGTSLATVSANTQGTQELLGILAPLIRPRDPQLLAAATAGLETVQQDLSTLRSAAGQWTPVAQLSTAQRQHLDADLGQLLETLADVPNLLYPRTDA